MPGSREPCWRERMRMVGCPTRARRVRKDGSRFWANVVITALYDRDGQVRGYLKVTRDDTDRRQAEQLARELERLQDREVLGQELSTAVINRVFNAGLMVEGLRSLSSDPLVHQRIDALVEELDAAINDLRSVLFSQDHGPSATTTHDESKDSFD